MKGQHQIIGGRYQYSPGSPLRQNSLYSEYKAYDRVTKRDLLMHLLPRDDKLVQVLRDVKHPFVVLVFDVVPLEEGNVAFLYENGAVANIGEVIENTGFLLEEDALVILKMLLLGLRELHEKLITFGRVCPDNILMWHSAMIKFGHSLYDGQVPASCQSPELLQGKKPTQASDVFGLGVILYKMLFGVLPFGGQTEKEVLKHIKGKDFNEQYKEGHSPFGIVVSKEVTFLVESMLDYRPENRPTVEQILGNSFLNFEVPEEQQAYTKPKVNLLPEPFIKKYLVYRPSKTLQKYDSYYQEHSYLALSTADKRMVTIYAPEVRMFEAEPRRVESFF